MSKGLWFWILYIVALLLVLVLSHQKKEHWLELLKKLIIMALLFILGWAEFGFVIQ